MTTKPHCFPSRSWCRSPDVVPGRWEDHRVPFSRIIVDGKSLPEHPRTRPPSTLPQPATCRQSLKAIRHRGQCRRSSGSSNLHEVQRLPSYLSELIQSQPFKKTASESSRKKSVFFQTWKALQRTVQCNLHLSRDSFFSPKGFQNGEHSNNYRSQHLLSTHYVPSPVSYGLLSTSPSTLESRYHYYLHFQRGKPGTKRFSILPQNTQLVKCEACLFTQANPGSKIWLYDTSVNCYLWSFYEYYSPDDTIYSSNFETWLIIRAWSPFNYTIMPLSIKTASILSHNGVKD